VRIDIKEGLRKAAEFYAIADSNKRMVEARRIEQGVYRKRKVHIQSKIFLVGRENITDERRQKVDTILEKYPELKGFYSAKEKITDTLPAAKSEEASKLLDNIIFKLKSMDDAELIRWGTH
jgi:transposase